MGTETMVEIIVTIIFVAILGGVNSLLSYLLDYCFYSEAGIFSKWLPFTAKLFLKFSDKKELELLSRSKDNPEYDNMLIQSAIRIPFFKITGGCAICTNVWLGAITFVVLNSFFHLNWAYIIPYILFSSAILRRIIK